MTIIALATTVIYVTIMLFFCMTPSSRRPK